MAVACTAIGLFVALFPGLWMGLFSDDPQIVRLGTWYLRIVGPIYGLYGLGMALYFATQGFGSDVWTVTANAVRLLASAGFAPIAIYGLDQRDRILRRHRRWILHVRSTDRCRDVAGQRAHNDAKPLIITGHSDGQPTCIDRASSDSWLAVLESKPPAREPAGRPWRCPEQEHFS